MGTSQSKQTLDEDQLQFAARVQSAISRLPLSLSAKTMANIAALGPLTRQRLKEFKIDDDDVLKSTLGDDISVADQGTIRNAVELAKSSKTKLEQRLITAIKCNDKITFDCAVALGATGIKIGIDEEMVRALENKAQALQDLEKNDSAVSTVKLPKLPKTLVHATADNSAILCALDNGRDIFLKRLLEMKSFIEPLVHNGASNKTPIQIFVERYNRANAASFDAELFSLLLQRSRIHSSADELVALETTAFKREIIPAIRVIEKEFESSASLRKRRPVSLWVTAISAAPPAMFDQLVQEVVLPEKIAVHRGSRPVPLLEFACERFGFQPSGKSFVVKMGGENFLLPTTSFENFLLGNINHGLLKSADTVANKIINAALTGAANSESNSNSNHGNNNNTAALAAASASPNSFVITSSGAVVQLQTGIFSNPEGPVCITKKICKLLQEGAKVTAKCLGDIFANPFPDELDDDHVFNQLINEQKAALNQPKSPYFSLSAKEKAEVVDKVKELAQTAVHERRAMLRQLVAAVPESQQVYADVVKGFNVRTLRDLHKCGFVFPYMTRRQMIAVSKPASEKRALLEQVSNEAKARDPAAAERIEKQEAEQLAANEREQQQQQQQGKKSSSLSKLNIPKEFTTTTASSDDDEDDDEENDDDDDYDDEECEEEEGGEENEEVEEQQEDCDEHNNNKNINNKNQQDKASSNNDHQSNSNTGDDDESVDENGEKKKKKGGPNSLRPEMKKMLQTVHNILIKGKEELMNEDDGGKTAAAAAAAASGDTTSANTQHKDFEFFKKCLVIQKKILKNNLAVTELGALCEQCHPSARAVVLVLQRHNIGQRLLCQAAFGGSVDVMRTLIEIAKISPDMQFSLAADLGGPASRFTLLQMMVSMGATDMVRELLAGGANPNYSVTAYDRTQGSESALSVACERGDAEVTKMLLDAGADFDFVNYNGLTPLEIAGKGRKQECVALIRQSKIDREKKRKEIAEQEKKAKREKEEARRREKEEKQREIDLERKKQLAEEALKQKAKEEEKEKKRKLRELLLEIDKKMQQLVKDDAKKRADISEEERKAFDDKTSKFNEKLEAIFAKEEQEKRSKELPCSVCQQTLPKNSFSRNQWTEKTDETRKCKTCVEAELAKEKEAQLQREKKEKEKAAAAAVAVTVTKEPTTTTKTDTPSSPPTSTKTATIATTTSTTPINPNAAKLLRFRHRNYFWDNVADVDATYERLIYSTAVTPEKLKEHAVIYFSFNEPTSSQQEKHAVNTGAAAAVATATTPAAATPSTSPKYYQVPITCFLTTRGILHFLEGPESRNVAVCFDYSNHGECKWGEKCKFGHPVSAKDATSILHEIAKTTKKYSKLASHTFPAQWGCTLPVVASNNIKPPTVTTTTSVTTVEAEAPAVVSSSTPTKSKKLSSPKDKIVIPKPNSASIINDGDDDEVTSATASPNSLQQQQQQQQQDKNRMFVAENDELFPSYVQHNQVMTMNNFHDNNHQPVMFMDATVQNMNAAADVFLPIQQNNMFAPQHQQDDIVGSLLSSLQSGFNNNNNAASIDFFSGGGSSSMNNNNIASNNNNNAMMNFGTTGFGNFIFDQAPPQQQQQQSTTANVSQKTLEQRVGISFDDYDDEQNNNGDDDDDEPEQGEYQHHRNSNFGYLRGASKKEKAAALQTSLMEAQTQLVKAQTAAAQILKLFNSSGRKNHQNINNNNRNDDDDESSDDSDSDDDKIFKIEALMEFDEYENALDLCKKEIEISSQRLAKLVSLQSEIERKLSGESKKKTKVNKKKY